VNGSLAPAETPVAATKRIARRSRSTPPWTPHPALASVAAGLPGDAFAVLGPHQAVDESVMETVLMHGAVAVHARCAGKRNWTALTSTSIDGVFAGVMRGNGRHVQLRVQWPQGEQTLWDPYAFGTLLSETVLQRIGEGDVDAMRQLGAVACCNEGIEGVRFAVWAPNARRVAVVGDFNGWDGRRHPMRLRHTAGVWEIFLPGVEAGARYKFCITAPNGQPLPYKADPMARWAELAPATASRVASPVAFQWHDQAWMARRGEWRQGPVSIYELHAGSWMRDEHGGVLDWDALSDRLIPHIQRLGFTHVELLPVSEHPFGGSWGYQPLGLYAPTARHGDPAQFATFVDRCHRAGIGVIVDWVSAHFPDDEHGLRQFDGTALYEHADPREGLHADWNTLIYNYGRNEVAAYLLGSALEWIERFHLDGLRVDAVASMLYRDYSRASGQWLANEHGGRENLEAVAFLKRLNQLVGQRHPGVLVMAEESTAWAGVTAPVEHGGLGFTHKWNMGWMHDTLMYMQRDPVHRAHHHSEVTFGLLYAFSEHFVLPLSHDEVVHGKGSLLSRMPGDRWRQFAQLRAYYGLMWAHPGSKLLFMGGEFGQQGEWRHDVGLDWCEASQPLNAGLMQLVADLNGVLRDQPACYRAEQDPGSFQWIIGDDRQNSVFSFLRRDPAGAAPPVLVVCNLTPVVRSDYRVGVPVAGFWREVINTDGAGYGGSNVGNDGGRQSDALPCHGQPHSLALQLPPLATLYLQVAA